MLPVVDLERLSDIFAIYWNLKPRNENEAAALRVITDAFLEQEPEKILQNAVAWIDAAERRGYRQGLKKADDLWESKIETIFGIGKSRQW